jgi:hypothetical protein
MNKWVTIIIGILVLFLIIGILGSGNNNTSNQTQTPSTSTPAASPTTSTPVETSSPTPVENPTQTPIEAVTQVTDIAQNSFEEQLNTEVHAKTLLADSENVSYNSDTNTLMVDFYKDSSEGDLKKWIFMDTANILEVAATHPEIKKVSINYDAQMLDENRNPVRTEVFGAMFNTTVTNSMNSVLH